MVYELMVIMKPLLPEDVKNNLIKSVEDLVGKHGGKVVSSDVWGKKHLAYKIDKHEEGYYIVYKIELDPKEAEEFDNQLKLNDGVIRFVRIKESEL